MKPPVVFLHGFLGRGTDWQAVTEALAHCFDIHCPNLPGHGLMENSDSSMAEYTTFLSRYLDQHGIDRCALVGYSMGGRAALHFAFHAPDRVSALVLESASPGLAEEEQRQQRQRRDEALAQRLEACAENRQAFQRFLEDWYNQPLFASLDRHPEIRKRLVQNRRDNAPRRLAAALRGMGTGTQASLWGKLDGLRAPALLMVGALDGKFQGIARSMAEGRSNIAMQVLKDCGHNMHLENPAGYTRALKQFLVANS
jgi:2-succinyl-6-hydroxy-2,4-cyclohexadiene-1-carboxylate synthase